MVDVEYKLIATVNGEQVFLYTSPVVETVEIALAQAVNAVEDKETKLLTELSDSLPFYYERGVK